MDANNNFFFGSGAIWIIEKNDVYGNKIQNPTPKMAGAIQDFSVDLSAEVKELFESGSQHAVALAKGKESVSGSFSLANMYGDALNAMYFGSVMEDGSNVTVQDTVGTVISVTNTITVTAPNSGVFNMDLGVVHGATYQPFQRVASAPITGQYSVDANGVYTFASADEGVKVYINFYYKSPTDGKTINSNTQKMGPTPSFTLIVSLAGPDGQACTLTLYKCVASKLGISTKLDEFVIPKIEFKAQRDELRRVYSLSQPNRN